MPGMCEMVGAAWPVRQTGVRHRPGDRITGPKDTDSRRCETV